MAMLNVIDVAAEVQDESRRGRGVPIPRVTELGAHLLLLSARKSSIGVDKNRKHHNSGNRRPLQQESQHDQNEPSVRRMAHVRVRSSRREFPVLLCCVKDTPSGRKQDKSTEYEDVA